MAQRRKNHLSVDLRQEFDQLLLAVGRQDGEGVLVDEGSQVGVNQNGVWRFHVYFTPCAFYLPLEQMRDRKNSAEHILI